MKKTWISFFILILWFGGSGSEGLAQTVSERIEMAKELFWAARFDSAQVLLSQAVDSAKGDALHDAYLYLGFVTSRQSGSEAVTQQYFVKAIKASPRWKPEIKNLPPDLKEPYLEQRSRLVGCVRLVTEPENAEYLAIGEQITSVTPDTICGLAEEEFEVMILMKDYHEVVVTVNPQPGQLQTQKVTLAPVAVKSGQKWWLWATIGGVVATSTALLATGGDSGGNGNPANGLPTPPRHPSN